MTMQEGVKQVGAVATGIVDSMKSSPLAIAMVLMNIALLLFLFYYLSRITSRTETTVQALFTSNDKLFTQWGQIVKDQGTLVEKTMHCILPEDVLKIIQSPPRPYQSEPPARPEASPATEDRRWFAAPTSVATEAAIRTAAMRRRRYPFWQFVLRAVALSVLLAFALTVIIASTYSLVKMLQ